VREKKRRKEEEEKNKKSFIILLELTLVVSHPLLSLELHSSS